MTFFIGNLGGLGALFCLVVSLLPLVLICWLLIEIIRWFRRH